MSDVGTKLLDTDGGGLSWGDVGEQNAFMVPTIRMEAIAQKAGNVGDCAESGIYLDQTMMDGETRYM